MSDCSGRAISIPKCFISRNLGAKQRPLATLSLSFFWQSKGILKDIHSRIEIFNLLLIKFFIYSKIGHPDEIIGTKIINCPSQLWMINLLFQQENAATKFQHSCVGQSHATASLKMPLKRSQLARDFILRPTGREAKLPAQGCAKL